MYTYYVLFGVKVSCIKGEESQDKFLAQNYKYKYELD